MSSPTTPLPDRLALAADHVVAWVSRRRWWLAALIWLGLFWVLVPLWLVARSGGARWSLVVAGVVWSAVAIGAVVDGATPPPSVEVADNPDDAPSPSATPTAAPPTPAPTPSPPSPTPSTAATVAPVPAPTSPTSSPTEAGATAGDTTPVTASPRGDDAPVVRLGRPVDVIDGDTFDLDGGVRVRLAIVDTPEVAFGVEPCGPEATDLAGRFLAGTTVAIYRPEGAPTTDPNGRLLGEVVRVTDGASLNVALVEAGLGRIDGRFTDEDPDLAARLRAAAADAPTPDCAEDAASGSDSAPPPASSDDGTDQQPSGEGVTIVDVRFDGPGDDVQPGDSEYVTLRNDGDDRVDLSNWRIVDKVDNEVRIASGYGIDAGATFRVYSGPGDNDPSSDRYYAGRGQAYLNNSGGDDLRLLDASGATVSTFSYSS